MSIDLDHARIRRVLLADGWHAVEDVDNVSSFRVGPLALGSSDDNTQQAGLGFTFIDHHTRKRLAGPFGAIRALETND